jgi:tetraacyldisaccharide 4'-kinase
LNTAWRDIFDNVWYGKHPAALALAPLGHAYQACAWARRAAYASGLFSVYRAVVPIIVVGNISVGGTGKTPLVIWLARKLRDFGFKPGIIGRGYRGVAKHWPQQVRADSDPVAVGDEAVLIAKRTGLPVAVGPNRGDAIEALRKHSGANIIVSDDGLQHYAMARDIEVAVIDGIRRFGNGACLPAGPLREPVTRLERVDLIVTNGLAARGEFPMRYVASHVHRLADIPETVAFEKFSPKTVHAVAGIGYPERFFAMLKRSGFRVTPHAFPDHHRFTPEDLDFSDRAPVLMTEKDAVKCGHFHDDRLWYVPIEVELPEVFERRLKTLLKRIFHGQEAA